MKPSRLTFLLLLALLPLALSAQVLGNYPMGCSCVNFKYACSGQSAAFPGGSVRVFCPDGTSRTTALSGKATGYCLTGANCPRPERICLSYKNWNICNFQGCNAQVFQILPRNLQINGETLGLYPLEGGSGSIFPCVGTDYATNINSVIERDKFLLCPGDEVVLKLPNFELPAASGLCLTVNVLDESGSLVEGGTFEHDAPELGGEDLDLTELFAGLSTGTIYRLEIILDCCDAEAESDCSMMTVKRAYFELEAPFSYGNFFFQNGNPFDPETCPPTQLIPTSSPLGPIVATTVCNVYAATISVVQNLNNTDVDVALYELNCAIPGGEGQLVGAFTIPSSQLQLGSYTILGLPSPGAECKCYRIEFSYDSGCEEALDSYYFRIGDDCTGLQGDGNSQLIAPSDSTSAGFLVFPNPVGTELFFEWGGIALNEVPSFELTIFNSQGQAIKAVTVPNEGQRFSMPADMPAGAYHYVVDWPNGRHSGTFIKAGR